jgi:hypothetical protein
MDYRTLQVAANGDGDNIKAREEIQTCVTSRAAAC